MMSRFLVLTLAVLLLPVTAHGQQPGIEFFETKIRPVLATHCYECHSADAQKAKKLKGGLLLDTRAGVLKGGDSGPALVPNNIKDSLLLKALRNEDGLKMPPRGKLPDQVVADFEAWVKMGAPDPRDGTQAVAKKEIDVEAGRRYWAFRPLQPVAPPASRTPGWAKTPLDHFILARLEAKQLTPTPLAGREPLARRP